jgi:hypothetical protein
MDRLDLLDMVVSKRRPLGADYSWAEFVVHMRCESLSLAAAVAQRTTWAQAYHKDMGILGLELELAAELGMMLCGKLPARSDLMSQMLLLVALLLVAVGSYRCT